MAPTGNGDTDTITIRDNVNNSSGSITAFTLRADTSGPTTNWTAPSAAAYLTITSYTPNWTVSFGDVGAPAVTYGTFVRQKTSLSANSCDTANWVDDTVETKNVTVTLASGSCGGAVIDAARLPNGEYADATISEVARTVLPGGWVAVVVDVAVVEAHRHERTIESRRNGDVREGAVPPVAVQPHCGPVRWLPQ